MNEYILTVRNYPYRIRESGEGKPFIWLHGMFHSLETEDIFSVFNFDILSRYVRLIRVELPAHGESPLPEDVNRLTWPSIADDIKEIASILNLKTYTIGGFSQGAGIAAHVAINNISVSGLALAMLPKIWDKRPKVRNTYQKMIDRLIEKGNGDILKKILKLVKYPPEYLIADEAITERINSLILEIPGQNIVKILEGAIASDLPPMGDMVTKLLQSVLLVGWADDPNHPYQTFQEIEHCMDLDDAFLIDELLNVKSATFRLLSFLFSSL